MLRRISEALPGCLIPKAYSGWWLASGYDEAASGSRVVEIWSMRLGEPKDLGSSYSGQDSQLIDFRDMSRYSLKRWELEAWLGSGSPKMGSGNCGLRPLSKIGGAEESGFWERWLMNLRRLIEREKMYCRQASCTAWCV